MNYKYAVYIKVRGQWEYWGDSDLNSNFIARQITEDLGTCEGIQFIEYNQEYNPTDIENAMKLYGAI